MTGRRPQTVPPPLSGTGQSTTPEASGQSIGICDRRSGRFKPRQGTAPEASTAQAIRLYRYSITYLTVLFAAVALDTVVRVQV